MGMLAEISDYKHLATNSSKLFVIVGAITVLKEAFAALIKVRNVKVFDLHRNVLEGRIDQLELNIKR